MLIELAVRDLGVITELRLVLGAGLTVVTGETGAGKTLIVDAIDLLAGGRADTTMVRAGAEEAVVEGRFVEADGEFVARRVIPAGGRSRAYLDGEMATAGTLADHVRRHVDLHAQHAHQSLVHTAGQRAALDRFAGVDTAPVDEARSELVQLRAELDDLGGDAASRERELEILGYQLGELDDAGVTDADEDERLAAEEAMLADVVAHRERGGAALADLDGEHGASATLGAAIRALGTDEVFATHRDRLAGVAAELDDVVSELRDRLEHIVDDPARLAEITRRRQLITTLRRRHGDGTVAGLIAEHARLHERVAALEDAEGRAERIVSAIQDATGRLAAAAAHVGAARRRAAGRFAAAVQAELRELAMPAARLEVAVPDEDPGDEVEFRFSANPGSPPLPLTKVASGGELARTMLALRLTAMADQTTVVFDEVDAGIGGSAALAVGAALARLAADRQVLVVTHLAQVAAAADHQIGVVKTVDGRATSTDAVELTGEARVVELSRMLSGQPTSESARTHARELLAAVRETGSHG